MDNRLPLYIDNEQEPYEENILYNNIIQRWIIDLSGSFSTRPLLFIDESEPIETNPFYDKNKLLWIQDLSTNNLRPLLFIDNDSPNPYEENSYYRNNNQQIWVQDLSTNNTRPLLFIEEAEPIETNPFYDKTKEKWNQDISAIQLRESTYIDDEHEPYESNPLYDKNIKKWKQDISAVELRDNDYLDDIHEHYEFNPLYDREKEEWTQDLSAIELRESMYIDDEQEPYESNPLYNKNIREWKRDISAVELRDNDYVDDTHEHYEFNPLYDREKEEWTQDLSAIEVRESMYIDDEQEPYEGNALYDKNIKEWKQDVSAVEVRDNDYVDDTHEHYEFNPLYNREKEEWSQDLSAIDIRESIYIDDEQEPYESNPLYDKNIKEWKRDISAVEVRDNDYVDDTHEHYEFNPLYDREKEVWIQDLSADNIRSIEFIDDDKREHYEFNPLYDKSKELLIQNEEFVGEPTHLLELGFICLSVYSRLSVINDNGLKYTFNEKDDFKDDKKIALYYGEFIIDNIPKEYPFGLLNFGKETIICYTGENKIEKGRIPIHRGDYLPCDFYYGKVTITVKGDFETISYYSYYEGFMGGSDKLIFSDLCKRRNFDYDVYHNRDYINHPLIMLSYDHSRSICSTLPFEKYVKQVEEKEPDVRIELAAFLGYGGFKIDFFTEREPDEEVIELEYYDFSQTLQLYLQTKKVNLNIGVIKDASNNLLSVDYNEDLKQLNNNVLFLSVNDVFNNANIETIKSLGSYKNFYTNFIEKINNYFAIGGLTNQLFSGVNKPENDLSGNIEYYNKLNLLRYLSDLDGFIKVPDINCILDYLVLTDAFNNRPKGVYTDKDGFLEGDKIFIKNGIRITFNLDILSGINNIGNIDASGNVRRDNFYQDDEFIAPINIEETMTANLLLELKDDI